MVQWKCTQFDPEIASLLGQLSSLAYVDGADDRSRSATALGFPDPVFVKENECTQALVLSKDQAIVVAFRGTDPNLLHNWITDFSAAFVPGPVGYVHAGFSAALACVWPDVLQEVDGRQEGRGQALWVTGHSLGGGLANLAVADLRLSGNRPVNGLYTFGCPRVGDAAFQQAFDQNFRGSAFRFVNQNDPVPRLPTRSMGYVHAGTLLHFDADQNLQRDPGFWNALLDSIKVDLEHPQAFLSAGIADHLMARYQEGLAKFLDAFQKLDPAAVSMVAAIRNNPPTQLTP
jgi:triacylglycerol lipase